MKILKAKTGKDINKILIKHYGFPNLRKKNTCNNKNPIEKKLSKYWIIALKRQCSIANVNYDKVNFKDDWYSKHSWTQAKENHFKKWLTTYVSENFREFAERGYKSKRRVNKIVEEWIFMYGWRVKDEEL